MWSREKKKNIINIKKIISNNNSPVYECMDGFIILSNYLDTEGKSIKLLQTFFLHARTIMNVLTNPD